MRELKATDSKNGVANLDKYKHTKGRVKIADLRLTMQKNMQTNCGVFRREKELKDGIEKHVKLYSELKDVGITDRSLIWNTDLIETLELENLMMSASYVVKSAENWKELRGAHAREDYPKRMDEMDYAKPLENKQKIPIEKHWRKHT